MNARIPCWLVIALLLLPVPGLGEEESVEDEGIEDEFALLEEELAADEVESASKHRQSIFWSPSAITVFTREDIRNSGANTLTDLLRRVPGFDVYEIKPTNPIVGARALTDESNNLILVLVDGYEQVVEAAGSSVLGGLNFDLVEIERVEVIRGPGSALYGANAYAGVVSITTVSDRPVGGADIYLSAGEMGSQRLYGRVRDTWDLNGGVLSFSAGLGTEERHSSSDRLSRIHAVDLRMHGYLRYRQGSRLDLSLHGGSSWGDAILYMHIGEAWGHNSITHYVMGKAKVGLGENTSLKVQLYHNRFYSFFHSRIRYRALGIWVADVPDFPAHTNTVDGKVQLDFQVTDDLLIIGGGNLRYLTMTSSKTIPSMMDEFRGAGFVHVEWRPWETLQLTGGLRLDINSETQTALSPRIVVILRPFPNHAFRLGFGMAFRKPSLLEGQAHMRVEHYNPAIPEVVDKLAKEWANDNLANEKISSFEAGWRGYFLDDRLQASLELFYNLYRDTIVFKSEMAVSSLGMPDLVHSTFHFINDNTEIHAWGGEAELTWRPSSHLTFWANLGLRRAFYTPSRERLLSEPLLRTNLGARFDLGNWLLADLAWHYVSSYEFELMDPANPLEDRLLISLGNNLLLVGRLGYRLALDDIQNLEAGLVVRAPLGQPFREFAGVPLPEHLSTDTTADFGGEMLVRLLSFYLKGNF